MAVSPPSPIVTLFVEVALPVPLRKVFTYNVPDDLRGDLEPGSRVAVSFNRRKLAGFVMNGRSDLPEGIERALPVAGLLEREPVFPPELLKFLDSAAKYYMHPLGEVLRAAAPALPSGAMRELRKGGFLREKEHLPGSQVGRRTTWRVRRATTDGATVPRLGPRQRAVLDALDEQGDLILEALRDVTSEPRAVVRSLHKKGLVLFDEVEVDRDPFFSTPVTREPPHRLTESQQVAVGAITEAITAATGEAFSAPRSDRFGQDGGVSARDRTRPIARPGNPLARARDRAHPATRRSVSRAIRRRDRGFAQWSQPQTPR